MVTREHKLDLNLTLAFFNVKKMAIKMKVKTWPKKISFVILIGSMYALKIKRKKCSSPFFYEVVERIIVQIKSLIFLVFYSATLL